MRKEMVIGLIFIFAGIASYMYYDKYIKPEREAEILLVEGKFIFERSTNETVNDAISIFAKIVAKYPESASAVEAYYLIARSYEKMGLHRLAYIKYTYLLKNTHNKPAQLETEIRARLAKLSIMREQTEEGVNGLLNALNNSSDPTFRSRVYAELGHTKLRARDHKGALRMFDIALNENGGNEEALLGKAMTLKSLGEDHKAYDLYEYFLKFFGSFSSYEKDVRASYLTQVYESGLHAFRRGEHFKAMEFFNRLINYFPASDRVEDALFLIGESNYALKRYNTALTYYQKVLSNNIHTRDEDARIKSGYSYFMLKRFDLAGREFQLYLRHYPTGRHVIMARKWYDMSLRELEQKLRPKPVPRPVPDRNLDPDLFDDDDDDYIDDDDFDLPPITLDDLDDDLFEASNSKPRKNNDPLRDLIEL